MSSRCALLRESKLMQSPHGEELGLELQVGRRISGTVKRESGLWSAADLTVKSGAGFIAAAVWGLGSQCFTVIERHKRYRTHEASVITYGTTNIVGESISSTDSPASPSQPTPYSKPSPQKALFPLHTASPSHYLPAGPHTAPQSPGR